MKAKTIIYVRIIVIIIDIFIIISRVYNRAELTELLEHTLVSSFLYLLTGKVNISKLQQFQLHISSQNTENHTHTHTHTHTPL